MSARGKLAAAAVVVAALSGSGYQANDMLTSSGCSGARAVLTASASACTTPTFPPQISAVPVLSGSAQVAQTLTCTTGTWTANGTISGYTYKWQDATAATGGVWADISAATASTYVIGSGEVNLYLRCRVVATNQYGTQYAASVATSQIAAASGGGGVSTANVWVVSSGAGGCSRDVSSVSLATATGSSHTCGSLDAANDIVIAGDVVGVKCGTYGDQTITGNRSAGPQVVYEPETDYCVTVDGLTQFTGGGAYSTLQGFVFQNTAGADSAVYKSVASATHISLLHDHLCVAVHITNPCLYLKNADDWTVSSNTFGPACCNAGSGSSPEGIRVGVETSSQDSDRMLISDNLIQGIVRQCADYPDHYTTVESATPQTSGVCPSVDCPTCHSDGIHIFGMTDSVITRNRIYNNGVQALFFEPTNGSLNSAITITNNMLATNPGDSNKCGICINGTATDSIGGAWVIAFNTIAAADQLTINQQAGSAFTPTTFAITGNVGPLYIVSDGGPSTCQGFATATATYAYNAWVTQGGAANQTCNGTGNLYPAAPTLAAITGGVSSLFDLHLSGAAGDADSLVPAATCTAITSVDVDGDARPRDTNCDAGADERHT